MNASIHSPQKHTPEQCALCAHRRRCEACFEELVRRYQTTLLHFLIKRTHSRHEAEDLLQETFLSAYKNIGQYRVEWKFSTWIFTIANRLAVSAWRQKSSAAKYQPPAEKEPVAPLHQLEMDESRKRFWDVAAAVLEPDSLAGLWLSYVETMSADEVGQVLGRTANAVRILLHRARTTLEQHLETAQIRIGDAR